VRGGHLQLQNTAKDLLKSPIIETALPASLSVTAHCSSVWRTYSSGQRGLWVFARKVSRRCHIVWGLLDLGSTITWMMERADRLYVMWILTTNASPDESVLL
jgi:hypothetical protein